MGSNVGCQASHCVSLCLSFPFCKSEIVHPASEVVVDIKEINRQKSTNKRPVSPVSPAISTYCSLFFGQKGPAGKLPRGWGRPGPGRRVATCSCHSPSQSSSKPGDRPAPSPGVCFMIQHLIISVESSPRPTCTCQFFQHIPSPPDLQSLPCLMDGPHSDLSNSQRADPESPGQTLSRLPSLRQYITSISRPWLPKSSQPPR